MEIREILSNCDHTLLAPQATFEEIRQVCDEGIRYGTASVCIPPCFVKEAKSYVGDRLPICTVIGFPTGAHSTAVKCFEAAEAVRHGADEVDMVIRLGWVKEKQEEKILSEINEVKAACEGRLLKVIIETCLLTKEEKILLCQLVSQSKADYIKTSTGFSTGGATKEDIALMRAYCAPSLKIKAAGGIGSLEDAEDFLRLGADRLGTSRIIKLAEKMQNRK